MYVPLLLLTYFILLTVPTVVRAQLDEGEDPPLEKGPFPTSAWCGQSNTFCWDDDHSRDAFSGVRFSIDLNLGFIWQGGRDRFISSELGSVGRFGIEINLYRGWLAYQAFVAIPGTLKLDEHSPMGLYAALPDTTADALGGGKLTADVAAAYAGTRMRQDSIRALKAQWKAKKSSAEYRAETKEVKKKLRAEQSAKEREIKARLSTYNRGVESGLDEGYEKLVDAVYLHYDRNPRAERDLEVGWGFGTGITVLNGQLALGAGRVFYDRRSLPLQAQRLSRSRYEERGVVSRLAPLRGWRKEPGFAPFDLNDTFVYLTFQPGAALNDQIERSSDGTPADE